MRHRKKKHLRGDKDRRRKELRALAQALVLYEKIETTHARARLTRSAVERMITRGKKQDLTARRMLARDLQRNAVNKILEVLSPRYQDRKGGYSRITQAGLMKDGTKKVRLELVK